MNDMFVYFLALGLNTGLWYLSRKNRYRFHSSLFFSKYSEKEFRIWCLRITFILLFVISAFRGYEVGTDTKNYVGYVTWIMEEFSTINEIDVEIGYKVILLISAMLKSTRVLLILSSAIVCYGYYYLIKKYSRNTFFSAFLFITLYIFCMSLNIQRQAIAMIFVCEYVMSLISKKGRRASVSLLLAIAFHKTAIVMLIVVPVVVCLNSDKIKKVFDECWVALLSVSYLCIDPIIKVACMIFPKYQFYLERDQYTVAMVKNELLMNCCIIGILVIAIIQLLVRIENMTTLGIEQKKAVTRVCEYAMLTLVAFVMLFCVSNNRIIGLIAIGTLILYKMANDTKVNKIYYQMSILTIYMVFLQAKMMIFSRLIWYPMVFLMLSIPAFTKKKKTQILIVSTIALLYFLKLLLGNSSEVLPYRMGFL